jgi:hypothetical protein
MAFFAALSNPKRSRQICRQRFSRRIEYHLTEIGFLRDLTFANEAAVACYLVNPAECRQR